MASKRRGAVGGRAVAEADEAAVEERAELALSSDEEEGASDFDIDSGDDTGSEGSGEGSEEQGEQEEGSSESGEDAEDEDAKAAIAEYYRAARDDDDGDSDDADGAEDEGGEEGRQSGAMGEQRPEDVEDTDSSEDERPNRNTIGNVPLKWYKHEEHIGYDREGGKLIKKGQRDKLEEHMAKQDGGKAWRTLYDEYNDEEIVLSKEELKMIQRIRMGKFPHLEVDPFPEYNDYFTRETQIHPVLNLPEPKRRFVRSKWEEKKVVKLVRAMRKGWLKRQTKQEAEEEPPLYLMWEDDNKISEKTAVGLSYIPPPKPQLPGHEQSYNPPQEYLPNEEEKKQWEETDEEDRAKFLPQQFECLRKVPMYANYIQERFERCLDMYLCPRTRKKRIHIDPESLVPKLPKPADLQPFPMTMCLEFLGHSAKVNSLGVDPTGQWLVSGSSDCTLRVWEVQTGRCFAKWQLPAAVSSVAWCPNAAQCLVSAVAGSSVYLLPAGTRTGELGEGGFRGLEGLEEAEGGAEAEGAEAKPLVRWQPYQGGGVELVHNFPVKSVTWHTQGDYFATVAPTGNTQAVIVHQLSKRKSQNPFRKNRGRVQLVKFHPSKPFFFVATSNHVRVYNLAKQSLAKKLVGGSGVITSLDVHSGGDNLIVGCEDNRLMWFDMDLSTKPYRALKYHNQPIRGVSYHRSYPLFATSSDDGTVQVFHGMVYSDLMTNPLIVPVKILRGHQVVDFQGVLDCKFHPNQPWLFSAGADHSIKLWCN
eukprot:jgi/Tetstr1/456227/TSEL_042990.t1